MRVLVLGHRGMLGSVVTRYLRQRNHSVILSASRYAGDANDELIRDVRTSRPDAVVNCAGVVMEGGRGLMMTNALLPQHLAVALGNQLLIHPSTDCVFDGRRGWYGVNEQPNATDDYGLSKRLGEGCATFPNVVVLRTSIVGPGERGLLGWFLRQPGPVDGWTDHIWNGITTLAWAELAADAIEGHIAPGLHQPTTIETITKYDLLRLFGEVFDHRIEVRPVNTRPCDRSLEPTIAMPPLRDQLAALRAWA